MENQILQWLAMLVWGATENIAGALGVHRTTALRRLRQLERQGLEAGPKSPGWGERFRQ